MKNIALKCIIACALLLAGACKETTLINIVHTDGSVTRRIEERDSENRLFAASDYLVPIDSSWSIKDTFELNENKDTTWLQIAEKTFSSVDGINSLYAADSSTNREFVRQASFSKKFRWFTTVYTYTEKVEKILDHGYDPADYFSGEELEYFYLPESVAGARENGPDSLHVREVEAQTDTIGEQWMGMSLVSEWTIEFAELAAKRTGWEQDKQALEGKETALFDQLKVFASDSTKNGNPETVVNKVILVVLGDEFCKKYKPEIDSSLADVMTKFGEAMSFHGYDIKTVMPGELVETNGFITDKGEVLWGLKMEHFFSRDYEMRAESKTTNHWAWVVSGIFVAFVAGGLVLRSLRKKRQRNITL